MHISKVETVSNGGRFRGLAAAGKPRIAEEMLDDGGSFPESPVATERPRLQPPLRGLALDKNASRQRRGGCNKTVREPTIRIREVSRTEPKAGILKDSPRK